MEESGDFVAGGKSQNKTLMFGTAGGRAGGEHATRSLLVRRENGENGENFETFHISQRQVFSIKKCRLAEWRKQEPTIISTFDESRSKRKLRIIHFARELFRNLPRRNGRFVQSRNGHSVTHAMQGVRVSCDVKSQIADSHAYRNYEQANHWGLIELHNEADVVYVLSWFSCCAGEDFYRRSWKEKLVAGRHFREAQQPIIPTS